MVILRTITIMIGLLSLLPSLCQAVEGKRIPLEKIVCVISGKCINDSTISEIILKELSNYNGIITYDKGFNGVTPLELVTTQEVVNWRCAYHKWNGRCHWKPETQWLPVSETFRLKSEWSPDLGEAQEKAQANCRNHLEEIFKMFPLCQ